MVAALAWQAEMGADEAILDAPVDRFALAKLQPKAVRATSAPAPAAVAPAVAPVPAVTAAAVAAACATLDDLRAAMTAFDGCDLKKGARSAVFADGNPAARVMIVGEAPGQEEDRLGLPFVGRSGQLLDRMFACIGLSRGSTNAASAIYITNTVPWRPPQNREPSTDEVAMMMPFLLRHIELAAPGVLVLMGRSSAQALLRTTEGIGRLRGRWAEVAGRPALPMFHPAALLRDPMKKREAWADLLALRERLGR